MVQITLSAEQTEGLKSLVERAQCDAVRVHSEEPRRSSEVTVDTYTHVGGWEMGWHLRVSGAYNRPGDNLWRTE